MSSKYKLGYRLLLICWHLLLVYLLVPGSTAAAVILAYRFIHSVSPELCTGRYPVFLFKFPFPAQIALAAIAGFFNRARFRDGFSLWVWIFPVAMFCIYFFSWQETAIYEPSFRERFVHFFGSSCELNNCWKEITGMIL